MYKNFKKQFWSFSVTFLFVILISTGCTQQAEVLQVCDESLLQLELPNQLTLWSTGSTYDYISDWDNNSTELIKKYEAVIEDMEDSYQKYDYIQQMVEYYKAVGEREKAIHYLEVLVYVDDVYYQSLGCEKLARIYFESREFEKGLQILEKVQVSNSNFKNLQMLKGDLYCGLGQYEKGIEAYQSILTLAEMYSPQNVVHYTSDVEKRLKNIEWYQQNRDVTIHGTVTVNGKSMPKITVGVKQRYTYEDFEPQFIELTNEEGYYSFKDLPLGDYQVFMKLDLNQWRHSQIAMKLNGQEYSFEKIGIESGEYQFDFSMESSFQLISPESGSKINNNQVTFRWEECFGAAYYVVKFGYRFTHERSGSQAHYVISNIGERVEINYLTFDLSRLNQLGLLESYSTNYIQTDQILGVIYPGAEITWEVEAYDQNDRLLSTSATQGQQLDELSNIVVDFGGYEPGDRELIRHKYLVALNKYLYEYEKKQERIVANKIRRVVDHMYFMYQYDNDHEIDVARFIKMVERATELIPEYKAMNTLANILFDQERYTEAKAVLLKMIDLQLEKTDDYKLLAMIQLQTANYSNAKVYWEQSDAVGYKLAYQILTGQEMNIDTSWQELEAQLLLMPNKLDTAKLEEFYLAINQNQQKRMKEILKGEDLTSCYLNLIWKLVTAYQPWNDYKFRQEIRSNSRELIKLMVLTEKEEQAFLKFVGFWL